MTGVQSALDPAGPHADAVATLSWIMFVGGGLIFLLVMGLLALALSASRPGWLAHRNVIVLGGIAFPVTVLSALLVYGLVLTRHVTALPGDAVQIHVIGEQFWWRVQYPGADGGPGAPMLETANEVHLPVGRPVRLTLTTADVIHSFWIPNLGGKLDMIPGQANALVLKADRTGVYRGQCTEYCGAAHALMAFDVVVRDDFDAWLAAQRKPAHESIYPDEQRGKALFLASGCGACHAVRGTPADGKLGPDLTHVGSRRSIAAGTWPNNKGTLAGWIADSQHLKPNNKMPSFPVFTGAELRAVAAYLESLK
jgi:cytochrome c oxidase subunit 2